ncbi:MAG: hypothetical protein H6Q54_1246, partial [Deltaproteobacteria bacterium]|nr:hypothetical protein [Deltaproteobacteria bacterium]
LIEFLEESYAYRNEQRLRESLWIELNKEWETDLTRKLGKQAHLTVHRNDNKYIQKILKKGTLVIYNSKERED